LVASERLILESNSTMQKKYVATAASLHMRLGTIANARRLATWAGKTVPENSTSCLNWNKQENGMYAPSNSRRH